MESNEIPDKIYISVIPSKFGGNKTTTCGKDFPNAVEYIRADAFLQKAKEAFCKATCNGHPPRSTCTSLGTCNQHDDFVKYIKGE